MVNSDRSHRVDADTATPTTDAPGRTADGTDTHARTDRRYVPTLGLAFFGIYIALLTPPIVSMTFKVQRLTDSPAAAAAALGTILALGGLCSLIASPVAGRLSDRTTSKFGMRRPWIVGGAAVAFLALLAIGTAPDLVTVGIAWCIVQLALSCALSALTATLPDQVPGTRRGRVSGIVGLTTPIATVGGTALVSLFSGDVLRFAVPGAICFVFASVFAFTLRDRVLVKPPTEPFRVGQLAGSFVFDIRAHSDFAWVWVARFAANFAYIGVATFLPIYVSGEFGLNESDTIALVLASHTILAVAIGISSPLGGWLSDRYDNRRFFVGLAGAVMACGLVLLAFAPTIGLVLVAQAIIGLGAGTFYSVDLALATQVLPSSDNTAKDLGVLNISSALPQSVAPAVGTAVIGVGASTALGGFTVWYLFAAGVALAGAALVYRVKSVR